MKHRVVLASVVCVLASAAWAQQSQTEAERKLREIRGEIKEVRQAKAVIDDKRDDATAKLKAANEKVGSSSKALANTESALTTQKRNIEALEAQRTTLEQRLAEQKATLAKLVKGAYLTGGDAPLKVLLSQDRVNEGQRALVQYQILQRDRNTKIQAIKADLNALVAVRTEIQAKQVALVNTQARQQRDLATLEQDRIARDKLVAQLNTQFDAKAAEEKALGKDAKALERTIANLRATAAREAARRKAREAREAREAAAQKAAAAENAKREKAYEEKVKNAAKRGAPPPPKPAVVAAPTPVRAPALQVGGLGWPVSGSLVEGFGGDSNGYLISAAAGTAVRAVADGKVVFAEWMNGYGLISIVDHGNGYMSLYAHNEALLKDVGDRVSKGDALATVGNSGGAGPPALYFELRRNGQPVNPAGWLQRR